MSVTSDASSLDEVTDLIRAAAAGTGTANHQNGASASPPANSLTPPPVRPGHTILRPSIVTPPPVPLIERMTRFGIPLAPPRVIPRSELSAADEALLAAAEISSDEDDRFNAAQRRHFHSASSLHWTNTANHVCSRCAPNCPRLYRARLTREYNNLPSEYRALVVGLMREQGHTVYEAIQYGMAARETDRRRARERRRERR